MYSKLGVYDITDKVYVQLLFSWNILLLLNIAGGHLNEWVCCCCKVASVVSDSVWPQRRQPSSHPCPWDSPGENTGWVAISFSNAWKWKSEVTQSCPTLSDPVDCSPPVSPVHGIPRQEYWSGLPLPSPWMSLAVLKSLHLLQYENCSCVLLFGGINGNTYSECHSDMPSSPVFTASFGREPD